jgi:AmmeMemoRadiSam system protein B
MRIRPAAVAGSWYPGSRGALERDVDHYLASASVDALGTITAIISPHAGLMFSGPVAAHAYKAVASREFDVAVLVGPSHHVGFEGVALYSEGGFESPLGVAYIDDEGARAMALSPIVQALPSAHRREHSLEMQLPFLQRVLPNARIVPLLMGYQTRDTITTLADALASAFAGRRALLVASTDLSHYFDAKTATTLDSRVQEAVNAFDAEALLHLFEQYPEHERGRYVACGGGPAISVLMASRLMGARAARVLKYAHSGEISGDYDAVVGYLAGAIFDPPIDD